MPELVRVEARDADPLGGGGQGGALEPLRAQHLATPTSEREVVAHLAHHVIRQIVDQEAGQRDLAALVSLGGPEHWPTAGDQRHRLSHQHSAPQEVDATDSERCGLAEPEAGIAQEQHQQPVVLAHRRRPGRAPTFGSFVHSAAVRNWLRTRGMEARRCVLD